MPVLKLRIQVSEFNSWNKGRVDKDFSIGLATGWLHVISDDF